MTHSHDVNNKKILEIIKEYNFNIIHMSGEFEIRNFNYNEILLYKHLQYPVIRITKRIPKNVSTHTISIILDKLNILKLKEFLNKEIYECIVCYENNDDNYDKQFLRCNNCLTFYCDNCMGKLTKCPVCSISIAHFDMGLSIVNGNLKHDEILSPQLLYKRINSMS